METTPYIAELQEVASLPDLEEGYRHLCALFSRYLTDRTQDAHVSLVGPFAKVDYLLKRHHASPMLHRQVNAARVHLRQVQDELARGENLAFCLSQPQFQRDADAFRRLMLLVEGWTPADSSDVDDLPSLRHSPETPDYLRVIVDRVEDGILRGRTLEGDEVVVSWSPADDDVWASDVVSGTQLNFIRPFRRDGVWHPEYVIYQPDYLVDISSLSRCVTEFADSTELYLLHQLEPSVTSEAILLGNFAGQLLDDALHHQGSPVDYSAQALHFMRHHALDLLTTPLSEDFHTQARRQQAHIQAVLTEDLPRTVAPFNSEEVVVEPSFYCEMLGLQGRMDFLQRDMRVLIEQKSGKAAFVPGDPHPETPKIRQEHYVQLLLYMALLRYNFRTTYEENNRELYAYLMYSRYREALQGMGFAPTLLQRAFRLRNNIVAAQQRYAYRGMQEILSWTPDTLKRQPVSGPLWNAYQRPALERLLSPLHTASSLERAYVLRMLQFVSLEHWLGKMGNHVKEASGFASTWQCSLEEKLDAGEIMIVNSTPVPHPNPHPLLEGEAALFVTKEVITTVVFTLQAINTPSPQGEGWGGVQSEGAGSFRPGDIVFFYPFTPGEVPDARRTMVFRASIQEITAERMTLRLRAEQTDVHLFDRYEGCHWAIEHDFIEASSTGLYRGVYSLLSAPKERRDLLLLQRTPKVDENRKLFGEYGHFNNLQLRVKQAQELFLIIGPPGTGKTSFGMLYTLQEQLQEPGSRVLVLSYTNRAVDEVCSKLLEQRIPFLRMGSELSCAEAYKPFLWDTQVSSCSNLAEARKLLMDVRVVVGTTTALTARQQLFSLLPFDLAIIDEASQILEPHLLAILSAKHGEQSAIRKVVMIGDHKQLPAVVQQRPQDSRVDDPQLHAIGLHDCALSLFERLLHRYSADSSVTFMLTRQGRMHPIIAEFPNRAFYEGRLDVVPLPHQQRTLQPLSGTGLSELVASSRVLFLPVEPSVSSPSDKVNVSEARLIAQLVYLAYQREGDAFDADVSVGVIVPYRHQISAVRQALAQYGVPLLQRITIDTVERYQGSQRRTIIYGFTVKKTYQLQFLTSQCFEENGQVIDRKLNVVMTRAQEHLVMLGNPRILQQNPLFAELIKRYGT